MWDTRLTDLDKGGSASCIVSFDFGQPWRGQFQYWHGTCFLVREKNESEDRWVNTFQPQRSVMGGSPQGSILGKLLFTISTDKISDGIQYKKDDLNCGIEETTLCDDCNELVVLGRSLARIRNDSPSDYGLDDIPFENEEEEETIPLEENGRSSDFSPSRLLTGQTFSQSTPTDRGQFAKFVPPGNIITSCLNDTFPDSTRRGDVEAGTQQSNSRCTSFYTF